MHFCDEMECSKDSHRQTISPVLKQNNAYQATTLPTGMNRFFFLAKLSAWVLTEEHVPLKSPVATGNSLLAWTATEWPALWFHIWRHNEIMIQIYTYICVCAQISAGLCRWMTQSAPVTVKREFTAVSNTQDVPFIVFQSRTAFLHRKPACRGTCCDSYRLQGHDKRNTV